ncbi:MAG TPA: hypothetical protein VKA76_05600, partial [Gammaproteobacteria bacterium]|nr:hypothetical protein [Gammaproteobacteria bacterium]
MYSIFRAVLAAAGLVVAVAAPAGASTTWVGTADYSAGSNGVTNAPTVGPFSAYDFGSGALLLRPTTASTLGVGSTLDGNFQTFVSDHGSGVSQGNLNGLSGPGTGTPYELTLAATLQEQITSIDNTTGTIGFSVTGGQARLYLSPTVDYSFTGDSGFTDGAPILQGTVLG